MSGGHDRLPTHTPSGTGSPWNAMTAVLAALAVLALALVVWEVASLRPRSHEVELKADNRSSALEAAQRFVALANTYDSDSFEQTTKQVAPLLSTKFRSSYVAANADLGELVTKTNLSSKGTVLKAGIASLDQDSAAVLVVADAATRSTVQNSQRHFRWEVDLVKVGGRWLVDDFKAVANASSGAP